MHPPDQYTKIRNSVIKISSYSFNFIFGLIFLVSASCSVSSMRTDRYRFTKWRKKAQPDEVVAYELYDLITDPDGLVNIAGNPASENIIRELSELMAASGIGMQIIR